MRVELATATSRSMLCRKRYRTHGRKRASKVLSSCVRFALHSLQLFSPRGYLRVQKSGRNESGSPLRSHMEFMIGMLMHVDISAVALRPNGNLNWHRHAMSGVDLSW